MWRGARGALVALDLRGQDRMPANDVNRAWAAGYALVDARASAGAWRVGELAVAPFLGVTNVLDARYVTSVTVNAAGARYFEPGAGRTIYLGTDLAAGRRGER
jgi:iron complex outermembrane receptor protein